MSNLTGVTLTGVTASLSGVPASVSAQVNVPATIAGNGSVQATYVLQANNGTTNQAQINLQFHGQRRHH